MSSIILYTILRLFVISVCFAPVYIHVFVYICVKLSVGEVVLSFIAIFDVFCEFVDSFVYI